MPELPEVENVRLSLVNKLVGKTVVDCNIMLDKIIKSPSEPNTFQNNIMSLTFTSLERRGKYLILNTNRGYRLVIHLGMTGLLIYVKNIEDIPAKYLKHLHVTITLDDKAFLCYCDIRRFGGLRLLYPGQAYPSLDNLGPEPFDKNVLNIFKQNIAKPKWKNKEIKLAIMEQSVIAGVGNIYASEALYDAGINPNRLVSSLINEDIERLLTSIQKILAFSISVGGSSINDYLNGEGEKGQFQNYLKAYDQEFCPLGHKIETKVIGGRNTFYCLVCQK